MLLLHILFFRVEFIVFPRFQCACSRLNSLSHSVRVKSPNIIIIDISISISLMRERNHIYTHTHTHITTNIFVFFLWLRKTHPIPIQYLFMLLRLLRVLAFDYVIAAAASSSDFFTAQVFLCDAKPKYKYIIFVDEFSMQKETFAFGSHKRIIAIEKPLQMTQFPMKIQHWIFNDNNNVWWCLSLCVCSRS